MKLEPVYLLAPEPEPPSMPTRRAFLLAGGMFAAGSICGGACGYTIGVVSSQGEEKVGEFAPSGDRELDYWRNLAVKAPLDELFARAPNFLTAQMADYKNDEVLWRGVDRLSHEIISNPDRRVGHVVIGVIIQNIQYLTSPPELKLGERVADLKRRRDEEKQRK
ncbi:MAG: hypothetical protein KDC98_01530 [Planctomycetes bacterium]|nr:hypothetical protein [Planctomycetota bacterium]